MSWKDLTGCSEGSRGTPRCGQKTSCALSAKGGKTPATGRGPSACGQPYHVPQKNYPLFSLSDAISELVRGGPCVHVSGNSKVLFQQRLCITCYKMEKADEVCYLLIAGLLGVPVNVDFVIK